MQNTILKTMFAQHEVTHGGAHTAWSQQWSKSVFYFETASAI